MNYEQTNRKLRELELMGFRYRNGSYKSRKAGIQPIRCSIKGTFPNKVVKFRVYGTPDTEMTKPQESFCKVMLATVKQCHDAMLKAGLIKEYHRKPNKHGELYY